MSDYHPRGKNDCPTTAESTADPAEGRDTSDSSTSGGQKTRIGQGNPTSTDEDELQIARDLDASRVVYSTTRKRHQSTWPHTIHLFSGCSAMQTAEAIAEVEAGDCPDTEICGLCQSLRNASSFTDSTGDSYPCPDCERSYATLANLVAHLGAEHPDRARSDEWSGDSNSTDDVSWEVLRNGGDGA